MDIDKVVDKMILEDCGFPKEVIDKVKDLDALIKEAKAIADQGKAEKILQFLGMDVSELGGDVLDKTAVALDKLLDWAASKAKGKEKMSPELAKMKADAEKRRGKKMEATDDDNICPTPGNKIRSKGRGRGMAVGKGRGPIGRMRFDDEDEELDTEGNTCPTPGQRIRSKGRGRGMAVGKGRGPIGRRAFEHVDFNKAVDGVIECEISDKVKAMKAEGKSKDEIAQELSKPEYNFDADALGEVITKVFAGTYKEED